MSDGERTGLTMSYNIRLLIDCPDHRGLIATVSSFIALHNGNILAPTSMSAMHPAAPSS